MHFRALFGHGAGWIRRWPILAVLYRSSTAGVLLVLVRALPLLHFLRTATPIKAVCFEKGSYS